MRSRRTVALLATLPILSFGLLGAGSPPPPGTLTYHGTFTAVEVTGPCSGGEATGQWNVRVPDRAGGVAVVFVQIKLDGQLHALWRMPFTLTEAASADSVSAHLELGTDNLDVDIEDGLLTYVLDIPDLGCTATFTGPQTS
jgi:hypothetical protein